MLNIVLIVGYVLLLIMSFNDAKTIKTLRAKNKELESALAETTNKGDAQNEE